MATTTIKYRFLVRGGIAAAIAALNEVPLARELIIETDTLKIKLGDGATHYNDLPYLSGGGASDASDVAYSGDIPGADVKTALDSVAASLAGFDAQFDAIGRLEITAGPSLAAGQFIRIDSDGLAYPADYQSANTAASMYVLSALTSGATGTAFTGSANTALSGLIPGAWYALGLNGAASLVADLSADSGTILQILGTATSSTSLAVSIQPAILRG